MKTCDYLLFVSVCLYQAESLSKVGVYVFLRENLLARQTLEHTLGLGHTGATDLDVAMFHRNGGTLTHNNLHACTYSHLHTHSLTDRWSFFTCQILVFVTLSCQN